MLDQKSIVKSIIAGSIVWRRHSLERMLRRDISRHDVLKVLRKGEQIEDYPADFPLPSGLFYGNICSRTLHVVAAMDDATGIIYIISAYEPDEQHFKRDLKTRRIN